MIPLRRGSRDALRRPPANPVSSWLILSLLLLLVSLCSSPVTAQAPPEEDVEAVGWGLWVGFEGDRFRPDAWPALHLCVLAESAILLTWTERDEPYRRIAPAPEAPRCVPSAGGVPLRVANASGEVRIVTLRFAPVALARPGSVALPAAGHGLLVPAGSPEAIATIRHDAADSPVSVLRWSSLESVPWTGAPLRADDTLLVLATAGEAGHGTLHWSDPAWIERAPRLGETLAVAALALLVVFAGSPVGRSRPSWRGG